MKKRTNIRRNIGILIALGLGILLQTVSIPSEGLLRVILRTVHPLYSVKEVDYYESFSRAVLSQISGTVQMYADLPAYDMALGDALTWQMLILEKEKEAAKGKEAQEKVDLSKEDKTKEEKSKEEALTDSVSVSDNALVSRFKSDAEKYAYYESLKDYDTLVQEFYQIDKTTYIDATELNGQAFLQKDMTMQQESDEPQILIYHTHSQEGYADSRPGNPEDTVMGMGELLAANLRAYGYNVVHHTGQYDVQSRDYAYANAAKGLDEIMKEYPTVEVVIDLHRDGVADKTRLVKEIDGKSCAQFMFFNGLCRTRKTGMLEKLPNPNLEDNLAFSFQLQLLAKEYYPTLVRRIYLKGMRYNMQYKPKSLLIELGAQTSTVEEAKNTIPYIAKLLDMVLSE